MYYILVLINELGAWCSCDGWCDRNSTRCAPTYGVNAARRHRAGKEMGGRACYRLLYTSLYTWQIEKNKLRRQITTLEQQKSQMQNSFKTQLADTQNQLQEIIRGSTRCRSKLSLLLQKTSSWKQKCMPKFCLLKKKNLSYLCRVSLCHPWPQILPRPTQSFLARRDSKVTGRTYTELMFVLIVVQRHRSKTCKDSQSCCHRWFETSFFSFVQ